MEVAAPLFAAIVMTVAGLLDLLYREMEPLYWFYATLIGGLLYLSEYHWLLARADLILVGLALVPVGLMLALYMAGVMGGADVMAMLFLSLAYPLAPDALLPIPVLTILYASIPSLAHRVWMASRVCGKPRCLLAGKVRVEAWRLLRDPRLRWWLVSDKRLGGLDVGAEIWEVVAKLGPKELVEVSPGLPYVAHLAVGFITALILGDRPVLWALRVLMGL